MLTQQRLSRTELQGIKRGYSVRNVTEFFFLFRALEALCRDLNKLRSNEGHPDPNLSFEDQMVLKWAEDVLAQLCPTQTQKLKERKDVTWARRATNALDYYYGYFRNWAHGALVVSLSPARHVQTFSCAIEPGTSGSSIQGNRGVSGTTPPNSVPATREGEMAVRLWNFIFLQEGYRRLKRCHYCEKWFVDKGKNRIAKFCSEGCTNRWWNKSRRLDSPNYGKRKKRRKGGIP